MYQNILVIIVFEPPFVNSAERKYLDASFRNGDKVFINIMHDYILFEFPQLKTFMFKDKVGL